MKLLKSSVIMIVCVAVLLGCAPRSAPRGHLAGGAMLTSEYYGTPPNLQTVPMKISQEKYIEALNRAAPANMMRAVRVHLRNEDPGRPTYQYRLFDIQEGDAFWLLGLRNADILVGAHGYVIFNAGQFFNYVSVLPQQAEGSIEIKRANKPILFQYTFVD